MSLREKLHDAIDDLLDGMYEKDILEHTGKLHIGFKALNEEPESEKMMKRNDTIVDFKHIITIHF